MPKNKYTNLISETDKSDFYFLNTNIFGFSFKILYLIKKNITLNKLSGL